MIEDSGGGVILADSLTQWFIAVGSVGSALVALALGLGLKEWIVRPKLRLLLRRRSAPTRSATR